MERAFKYQALGNDFVILDRRASGQDLAPGQARALCDRHLGLGADGVLVVLPAPAPAAARMVVHNADGTVAEMCGNGLRCVVKYLVDHGGDRPESVPVATGAGLLASRVYYQGGVAQEVEVQMGAARLGFVDQPLPGHPQLKGTAVSLGNPHLVLFGTPLEDAARLGPQLEHLACFPQRTNVELARPEPGGFQVVVWERGVGLTQACGTGACAVAAAAVRLGRTSPGEWVAIRLPGGVLRVRVEPDLSAVAMRGPATFVFEAVVPSL